MRWRREEVNRRLRTVRVEAENSGRVERAWLDQASERCTSYTSD